MKVKARVCECLCGHRVPYTERLGNVPWLCLDCVQDWYSANPLHISPVLEGNDRLAKVLGIVP